MITQMDVYGLRVSNFSVDDVFTLYNEAVESRSNAVVFGHSLGYIAMFKKFPELYAITNGFDLMVCDGTQFNWFCRLLGFKLKTVFSIPDITNFTMAYANTRQLRVLLLGATSEVNALANTKLKERYKNAFFLEGIDGYFKEADEQDLVKKINQSRVDVLLIGISSPKKELFTHQYRADLNVGIIIPCGGMIDVYAEVTKQTPPLIKKMGMATPYRVLQEPRRLLWINVWMIYEIFFKIIPLAFYNKIVLRDKNFNLVLKYIKQ